MTNAHPARPVTPWLWTVGGVTCTLGLGAVWFSLILWSNVQTMGAPPLWTDILQLALAVGIAGCFAMALKFNPRWIGAGVGVFVAAWSVYTWLSYPGGQHTDPPVWVFLALLAAAFPSMLCFGISLIRIPRSTVPAVPAGPLPHPNSNT